MKVVKMTVDTYQAGVWSFKSGACHLELIDVRAWCGDNFPEVARTMYILKKTDGVATVQCLPISTLGPLDLSLVRHTSS